MTLETFMNQMTFMVLTLMMTLKASIARKMRQKGSGPYKALNAIGVVIESSAKKRALSCKI